MRFTVSLKIYKTSSQGLNRFRVKTIINLPITPHLLRRLDLLRTSACVYPLPSPVLLRTNNPWFQHVPNIALII